MPKPLTGLSKRNSIKKKKEVVASPTFEASTQSLVLVARCYNFSLARPYL